MPVLLCPGCEGDSPVAIGWGVCCYNCVGVRKTWVNAVRDFRLGQEGQANIGVIKHAACSGKAAVAAAADVIRAEADIRALVSSLGLALLC